MKTLSEFKKEFDSYVEAHGEKFYADTVHGNHPWLARNANTMVKNGGKRLRPYMLYYFLDKKEDYLQMCYLIESIHTATLIIDDIQDNSDERRGKPALHKVVPLGLAINVGSTMFFVDKTFYGCGAEAEKVCNNTLLTIWLGQGDEMALNDRKLADIKTEEVMSIYDRKTSALFQLCYRLACMRNGKSVDEAVLYDLREFGRYFQIKDDADDIPSGGDLVEKKITIPLMMMKESHEVLLQNFLDGVTSWQDVHKVMIAEDIETKAREVAESHLSNIKTPLVKELLGNLRK